jgi:hypothetical protein
MPSGGKRKGAGAKRRLTPAIREKVAREYHLRMNVVYAATQAYARDPNTIKRREIDEQMRVLAKKYMAVSGDPASLLDPEEDVVWTDSHKPLWPKLEKLKAMRDDIPKSAATPFGPPGGCEKAFSET